MAEGDRGEETRAALSLPPADHERIAKCLINAFFQDALLGRTAYAGYMEGTVLPRSLQGLEIHPQHSSAVDRTVIDNFGDEDAQLGIAAEPLDPASNTRNGTVNAGGTGLVDWEDVEHVDLSRSPHNTREGA